MNTNSATPGSLGSRIRQARQAAGMSAQQLAAKAGVAASNISRIESGETATPTVELLKRISDALGLDLAEMLAYRGITFDRHPHVDAVATYLRSLHLPDDAVAEAEAEIERITRKYRHGSDPGSSD